MPNTKRYMLNVNGKQRTVAADKFNDKVDMFVSEMPDATIRMRDKEGTERDVKMDDLSSAYDAGYQFVETDKPIYVNTKDPNAKPAQQAQAAAPQQQRQQAPTTTAQEQQRQRAEQQKAAQQNPVLNGSLLQQAINQSQYQFKPVVKSQDVKIPYASGLISQATDPDRAANGQPATPAVQQANQPFAGAQEQQQQAPSAQQQAQMANVPQLEQEPEAVITAKLPEGKSSKGFVENRDQYKTEDLLNKMYQYVQLTNGASDIHKVNDLVNADKDLTNLPPKTKKVLYDEARRMYMRQSAADIATKIVGNIPEGATTEEVKKAIEEIYYRPDFLPNFVTANANWTDEDKRSAQNRYSGQGYYDLVKAYTQKLLQQKGYDEGTAGMLTSGMFTKQEFLQRDKNSRVAADMIGDLAQKPIDDAISKFDQLAKQAFEKEINSDNFAGMPGGMRMGMVGEATRQANEAKDPKKVLDYLATQVKKIVQNPEFVKQMQANADKLGMDLGDYYRTYVEKQLGDAITNRYMQTEMARQMPKSSLEYILKTGLGNSIIGQIGRKLTQTNYQNWLEDMANSDYEQKHAGFWDKVASGAVTFGADMWSYLIPGGVGAKVSEKAAAGAVKKLAADLTSHGMEKAAAERAAKVILEKQLGFTIKKSAISNAIAFGGQSVIATPVNEAYRNGQPQGDGTTYQTSVGKIVGHTVVNTAKNAAMGALMQGNTVGQFLTRGKGVWANVLGGQLGTAADAGIMGTSSLLERMASDPSFTPTGKDAAESFLESYVSLNLLGLPHKATKYLNFRNQQEFNRKFQFNDDDLHVLNEKGYAGLYDAFLKMGQDSRGPQEAEQPGVRSKADADYEVMRQHTPEYMQLLRDPDVPETTKAKMMNVIEGKRPDAFSPVINSEVTPDEYGDGATLTTYNQDGGVIDRRHYDSAADADKDNDRLRWQKEVNTTGALEGMYNNIYLQNDLRRQYEQVVSKQQRGEELTDEEKKAVYLFQNAKKFSDVAERRNRGEELTEDEANLFNSYRQVYNDLQQGTEAATMYAENFEASMGLSKGALQAAMKGHTKREATSLLQEGEQVVDAGDGHFRTPAEQRIVKAYQEALRADIQNAPPTIYDHATEERQQAGPGAQQSQEPEQPADQAPQDIDESPNVPTPPDAPRGLPPVDSGGTGGDGGVSPEKPVGPAGQQPAGQGPEAPQGGTGAGEGEAPLTPTQQRREAAYNHGASAAEDRSVLPQLEYENRLARHRMDMLFPMSEPKNAKFVHDLNALVEAGDDDAVQQFLDGQNLTPYQREAVEAYLDVQEAQAGQDDSIYQQTADYEQERREQLQTVVSDQGTIIPVLLDDGTEAYVKSGDVTNQYGGIIVVDEDGQTQQVPVRRIKQLGEAVPLNDALKADVDTFTMQLDDQYRNLRASVGLMPGMETDLRVAGKDLHVKVAGQDPNGNTIFEGEDGSRFALSPLEASGYVAEADYAKIEAQLQQEAQQNKANEQKDRFTTGIVGYNEGHPDYSAKGTDASAAAEYLRTTAPDGKTDGVLKNIQAEKDQLKEHERRIRFDLDRHTQWMETNGDMYTPEQKAQKDALIKRLQEELSDNLQRQRKWGEIRKGVMTGEQRAQFAQERANKVGKAVEHARAEVAKANPQVLAPEKPKELSGESLLANFPTQGDAERFITDKRMELQKQWSNGVGSEMADVRRLIGDYEDGAAELSDVEIQEAANRMAALEQQEKTLLQTQKQLKDTLGALTNIYAQRNAEEIKKLPPEEQRAAALSGAKNVQDLWKKAHEVYDGTEAGFLLDAEEPQTLEEFVASHLGPHTINWEGIERGGVKYTGLQQELGTRRGIGHGYDSNTINYFLAPKGHGKSVDAIVHEMWESALSTPGFENVGTQEIRNALLDLLSSARKPSDITYMIVRNRIADAEEFLRAQEEQERQYMEEEAAERQAKIQEYQDYLDAMSADEPSPEVEAYIDGLIADDIAKREEERQAYEEAINQMLPEQAELLNEIENGENQQQPTVAGSRRMDQEPQRPAAKTGNGQGETPVPRKEPSQPGVEGTHTAEPERKPAQAPVPTGNGHANGGVPVQSEAKSGEVGTSGDDIAVMEPESEAPLSVDKADSIIKAMSQGAVVDPEISLTPENWMSTFGFNNQIGTPIGKVKMGEHQYNKLVDKKRTKEFGMVSLTLTDPDVIFIEPSEAKEGTITERPYSYVFVKTFKKSDGTTTKYFTSVTVSQEGLEVSVSSHYNNENKIKQKLTEYRRKYTKQALLSNSSDRRLAEHQNDVPDLLPTQENNASSEGKGSENSATMQRNEQKNAPGNDTREKSASSGDIAAARKEVDTHPTDAQKEAGNYKKGHVKIDGYDITIENPNGSTRTGHGKDGKEWSVKMNYDYGYIKGTEGVDGDHIDVYLSDDPTTGNVYVVDQVNQSDGSFDEHKVMYGFPSKEAAIEAYKSQYEKGWKVGTVTEVSKDDFKAWVESSHRKTKPFADYKLAKDKAYVQQHLVIGGIPKPKSAPEEKPESKYKKGELVMYRGQMAKIDSVNEDGTYNVVSGPKYLPVTSMNVAEADIAGTTDAITKQAYNIMAANLKKQGKLMKPGLINAAIRDRDQAIDELTPRVEKGEQTGPFRGNKSVDLFSTLLKAMGERDALQDYMDHVRPEEQKQAEQANQEKQKQQKAKKDAEKKQEQSKAGGSKKRKTNNKIITDDAYEQLKKRMRDKLNNLNSGIDPELFMIGSQMAMYHIEAGARKFAEYARRMIEDCGDKIRPYLKAFYDAARQMDDMKEYRKEMSSHDEVDNFDVEKFDPTKEEKTAAEPIKVTDADSLLAEVNRRNEVAQASKPENSGKAANKPEEPEAPTVEAQAPEPIPSPTIGSTDGGEMIDKAEDNPGYSITQRWHKKKGIDIWVVNFTERFDRDKFLDLKKQVKSFGGYYSSFGKAGFVFESGEADAKKFAESVLGKQNNDETGNEPANTEAIASQAEAIASQAESVAETATTEDEVNDAQKKIDEQLEKVDEQLALLGFYKHDPNSPEHESYGYMKSAEKLALKDANRLAKEIYAALGQKTNKRNLANANLAPIGGDIYMKIDLPGTGKYIYINLNLDRNDFDDLVLGRIMYRLQGEGRSESNHFTAVDTPLSTFLEDMKRLARSTGYEVPETPAPKSKPTKAAKSKKATVQEPSLFDMIEPQNPKADEQLGIKTTDTVQPAAEDPAPQEGGNDNRTADAVEQYLNTLTPRKREMAKMLLNEKQDWGEGYKTVAEYIDQWAREGKNQVKMQKSHDGKKGYEILSDAGDHLHYIDEPTYEYAVLRGMKGDPERDKFYFVWNECGRPDLARINKILEQAKIDLALTQGSKHVLKRIEDFELMRNFIVRDMVDAIRSGKQPMQNDEQRDYLKRWIAEAQSAVGDEKFTQLVKKAVDEANKLIADYEKRKAAKQDEAASPLKPTDEDYLSEKNLLTLSSSKFFSALKDVNAKAAVRYASDHATDTADVLKQELTRLRDLRDQLTNSMNGSHTLNKHRHFEIELEKVKGQIDAAEELLARENAAHAEHPKLNIGDKVIYKGEPATVTDFETTGQPVLDTGLAPVMYEVADWEDITLPETKKPENSVSLPTEHEVKTDNHGQETTATGGGAEKPANPKPGVLGTAKTGSDAGVQAGGTGAASSAGTTGSKPGGHSGSVRRPGTRPTSSGDLFDRSDFGDTESPDAGTVHADGGRGGQRPVNGGLDKPDRGGRPAPTGSKTPASKPASKPKPEVKDDIRPDDHSTKTASEKEKPLNTRNYLYPDDATDIDNMNAGQRLRTNIRALEILRDCLRQGRPATPEERAELGKFRGWGGTDGSMWYDYDYMRRRGSADVAKLADILEEIDPHNEHKLLDDIQHAALTSYYTPVDVARGINHFLDRAGYKGGGSFLDGSIGSGVLEGTMPKSMQQRTQIYGTELDWLTGNIVKLLYPDANIRIIGFQDAGFPDNSMSVVGSNIPFGDIAVNDPSWKGTSEPVKKFAQSRIHNYFTVKNISLLKPGGIGYIMTSNAIMDTKGNQLVRKYIADNCEILGAVRLPDNAFKGAGTNPVTDIIFFRKYKDGEDKTATRTEQYLSDIETPFLSDYEEEIQQKWESAVVHYNGYYGKHPEMVIGNIKLGNQYRGDAYGLTSDLSTAEIAQKLTDLIDKYVVPASRKGKLYDTTKSSRQVYDAVREEYVGNGDYQGDGNIVEQNGKFGYLSKPKGDKSGTFQFLADPKLASQAAKIRLMIPVRTAMKQLIAEEIGGAEEAQVKLLRAKLKQAYNNFVAHYGRLNDKKNDFIKKDIDGYSILSLEKMNDGKFAGLSDIFEKSTIKSKIDLDSASTPSEMITLSLAEYGEIRPEYMESKLGPDWIDKVDGVVFEEPGGGYQMRDLYLSGNVKAKLKEAEAAAKMDHRFDRNVEALKAVQPADIPFIGIAIHMGARWVPDDIYTAFIQDLLGVDRYNANTGIVYSPEADVFNVYIEGYETSGKANEWKTEHCNNQKLIEAALTNNKVTVRLKDRDGHEYTDEDETNSANDKIDQIREKFEDFISAHHDISDRLTKIYNEKFNTTVIPKFDGSHLQIPGLQGKTLRPHQKDAVWMLINNRGGIIDHIVGAGKTLVMHSAIMEMRRMGIAKKPMIIALKATVPQMVKEFHEAFPTARVLAPMDNDFKKENRKQMLSRIAVNDWDCVILSHEQYGMLPHKEEIETGILQEQIDQLEAAIEILKQASGNSQLTKRQQKALEKRRERLKVKVQRLLDRKVDREFTFEDLGVDYLFVDECQQFKNLAYVTTHNRIAGLSNPEGSARSMALLCGARYLQQLHQGDQGLILASGTTISNSLVELYSLFQYIRPNKMKELGFNTFDAWAANFAECSTEGEFDYKGELVDKARFRNFENLAELAKLYTEVADVRNDLNLQLPKPKMNVHVVTVPASDSLKEITREVLNMVRNHHGGYFGIPDKTASGQDQPWALLATNISTKAAINVKLVKPDMDDGDGGKITYVCDNVKKIYDKFSADKGTQVIFCDLGVPDGKKEYDVYTDFINRLSTDYGIPKEEIFDIHKANTDKKRAELCKKMNDGTVRILIGGAKNAGTGLNIQQRMVAIHHVDMSWNPANVTQENGRGARQGNWLARDKNDDKVEVFYYATEQSLDLYKYQLVSTKQRMIDAFKVSASNGSEARSFDEGAAGDDSDFDPASVVALLSGNPIILDKSKMDKKVDKLIKAKRQYMVEHEQRVNQFYRDKRSLSNFEALKRGNARDQEIITDAGFKPDKEGKYPSTVTVTSDKHPEGQKFTKAGEAGKYIHSLLKKGEMVKLSGFGIDAEVGTPTTDLKISTQPVRKVILRAPSKIKYEGVLSDDDTAAGMTYRRMLEKVINNGKAYQQAIDEYKHKLEGGDPGEPNFPREAELAEALEQKKKIDAEYKKLTADNKDKKPEGDEGNKNSTNDISKRSSTALFDEFGQRWIEDQETSTGQHSTQIRSTEKTYIKIGNWMQREQERTGKTLTVLDASSGLGYGTMTLRGQSENGQSAGFNFTVDDVEPYPAEHREAGAPTFTDYAAIDKDYDVVISNAVLNVIPDDWRANVLSDMVRHMKTGGKLIINVRDAKEIEKQKQKIELDSPSEILVTDKKGKIRAYQKGFTQSELENWVQESLGNGFSVEAAGKVIPELKGARAVVVTKLTDQEGDKQYRLQVEAAQETAEQLGGMPVHFDNMSTISNESLRREIQGGDGTKGWYDWKDGSVHVYTPAMQGVDDVKRTVFHEKLGHEGLRALLGSDDAVKQFGTFIFESAGKELRDRILDKAEELGGVDLTDNNPYSEAAQEVFSDIAEEGPATPEEFSLWRKVKHYLIRFLNKIGLRVRGLLNDHDLRYYVLRTGKALKNWKGMTDAEKEEAATRDDRFSKRTKGKPRKRKDEDMAHYFQRLREWEKWHMAEEASKAANDPMPKEEDYTEKYNKNYQEDLAQWKKDNGIAEDEEGAGTFPKREEDETPQDYAIRVADYETKSDLWQTAPDYFKYQKDAADAFRNDYNEWKTRYGIQEQESVDEMLYSGTGPEEPQTEEEFQSEAEIESRMDRDMADAVGVDVTPQGARRQAKLAVIERRKNLESASAEDAIFIHDLMKRIDTVAKRKGMKPEELREQIIYMIEAPLVENELKADVDDMTNALNISRTFADSHFYIEGEGLRDAKDELKKFVDLYLQEGKQPSSRLAKQQLSEAASAVAKKLNKFYENNPKAQGILDRSDVIRMAQTFANAYLADVELGYQQADGIDPDIKPIIDEIHDWYDNFFHLLEDAGLRGGAGYIENGYINHVWDKDKSDPSAWEEYVDNFQRTKSKNMKHREILTYKDGIKIGLVPKFTDVGKLIAYYSRSNNEAIANRKFLDDLSFITISETNKDGEVTRTLPLMDSNKPSAFNEERYAMYHIPGVGDVWVLKDIQRRFASIFGTMRTKDIPDWLSKVGKGCDLGASTMKKIQLSFSGFHALALTEVAGAQMRPDRAAKALVKYIILDSIKKRTIPAYAHPEDYKLAASHLVQLGATQDYAAADVNMITEKLRNYVKKLAASDSAGIKAAGVAGTPLATMLDWMNKGMDKVLWNYLHDGLKIACFKLFAEQVAKRVEKEGLSAEQHDQLLDEAGQYVNDSFGGQYWELLDVTPAQLKWMRRLLLSPDWLVSTQRHFFANFGFGSLYSEGGFLNYLRYNRDNLKRAFGFSIPRNEFRRFRSKSAKQCYILGVLVFYNIMWNALNAFFRAQDEEKEKEKAEKMRLTNPDYKSPYELAYPDGMKWYDYTMYGNSLGQQTHLFVGRYKDGTEWYARWGKQFREFPEMFIGRHGLEFPTPMIERMMGKSNPIIGTGIDVFGTLGVHGFSNTYGDDMTDIQNKYGKQIAALAVTARHFMPFSVPTQSDKEFKMLDIVMPSQKGFTRYKTVDFFKTFILSGDMGGVLLTYRAATMNGIDAKKCLEAAITTLKAEQKNEMGDGIVDLQTAFEKYDKAETLSEKKYLRNKINKYLAAENYQAFTRDEAMSQVNDFLNGSYNDVEQESDKYLMQTTAADIRDDYKLKALKKQAKKYVDQVKEAQTAGDDATAARLGQRYGAWFAINDILNKATSAIGKAKKQLGQGHDAEVMKQIREIRQQAQRAVDEIETPK